MTEMMDCNHNQIITIEGSSVVISCPICGWKVVTSHINPMFEDETLYEIFLCKGNAINVETIKAISKTRVCNFLEARNCLEKAPLVIFKGKAADIVEARKKLDLADINYRIEPNFKY